MRRAHDRVKTYKLAHISGVLGDLAIDKRSSFAHGWVENAHLHLLDLLSQRCTITGTVLSGDADLLCACSRSATAWIEGRGRSTLGHFGGCERLCIGVGRSMDI